MGGFLSNQTNDDYYESDDSSYSEEGNDSRKTHYESSSHESSGSICLDSADTVDATLSESIMTITLTLDQVMLIENELDDYEIVSIIYLIYDDPSSALEQLIKLLEGCHDKLLFNWAIHENSAGRKWQEKLVEALCIIQNFQILSELGFKKPDLITRFLPHHIFTFVYVNKVRKALYFVCEGLLQNDIEKLLNLASKDFKERGLDFRFITFSFLELFFLHWESVGYIKQSDLGSLCRILKQIDQLDICDKLKEIVPVSQTLTPQVTNNGSFKRSDSNENRKRSLNVFEGILDPSSSLQTLVSLETSHISADNAEYVSDDNKYFIDPNNPGICLIINQENFYREIDKECQNLLPPEDKKLESRRGTQHDKEKLAATFKRFGFKTEVSDNLTHWKIMDKIEEVLLKVKNESSVFICIMSHGDEGVVYGVNSCRVSVKSIQKLLCSKNRQTLSGKPKILILQSCQGTRCQKIASEDDDDIVTDSPSSSDHEVVPPRADLFTFWATVPGYSAIRNKKTGSWFIQSLCDKMTELGNKHHFEDICTNVIADVSSKKWCQRKNEVAMVPLKDSTLRKLLYLPPIRV